MKHPDVNEEQELALKLMVVLSKAYKSIMDKASKDIRTFGLSPSEFGILDVLYTKGRIPIQQIGEKILLTSGSMTYNIDKLENKELLRRIPCPDDRRIIYAELTDKGKTLFDEIFPRHIAHVKEMMSSLTNSQKQEAIQLLKLLGKGE